MFQNVLVDDSCFVILCLNNYVLSVRQNNYVLSVRQTKWLIKFYESKLNTMTLIHAKLNTMALTHAKLISLHLNLAMGKGKKKTKEKAYALTYWVNLIQLSNPRQPNNTKQVWKCTKSTQKFERSASQPLSTKDLT